MMRYDRATGLLALRDDAGVWQPGIPIPAATTQQNSQCSINFAGSAAVLSGNTLTLSVAVTFKPAYAGPKNVYLYATTVGGSSTDWQPRGTWTVNNPALVSAVSVTPSSGSGATGTFSALYSDSAGATDLAQVYLRFATTPTGAANVCMMRYDRATGLLALRDDAGVWKPGATIPSTTTQQNSQCSINFAGSSAVLSGNTLTLSVAVTFKPAYAGPKNVYLYATTVGGSSTDWQPRGTWTVNNPILVTAVSVTPSSGSGATETFTALYSDLAGATDLAQVYLRFATTPTGPANVCMVRYDRASGLLALRDDAGVWQPGATIPSATTQQNSQCSIDFAGSSAVLSGNDLTLTIVVSFETAYAGAKNIYLYAANVGGEIADWQQRGTWTVTSAD
jgi:hypothetical protein